MWKPGMATSDGWVTATASLPVAFAQVREDPRIDRRLIEEIGSRGRALMIAGQSSESMARASCGRGPCGFIAAGRQRQKNTPTMIAVPGEVPDGFTKTLTRSGQCRSPFR